MQNDFITHPHGPAALRLGAIVLAGGQSRRMGKPKPWLPFGHETMLERVVRLVSTETGPVVVVAAAEQQLPALPAAVEVARDRSPACGPLEGLAAGLDALGERVEAAFVCSCDLPLLEPAVIRVLAAQLETMQAAVPVIEGRLQPLMAVYRATTRSIAEAMLRAGKRRMTEFVASLERRELGARELAAVDPELRSLMNVNTPQEYSETLNLLSAVQARQTSSSKHEN